MKRIILINLAILFGFVAIAQSEFDALKYVQPDIYGTARYSSMAGAFGALGGDPSAVRDNPAGLGIYRKSEFTTTIDFKEHSAKSIWYSSNETKDNFYKFGFNQFSYVLSIPTSKSSRKSLQYSNFSISYNRLRNLDRSIRINGGSGATSSLTDYIAYFTGDSNPADLYEVDGYNPYNNVNVSWLSTIFANSGLIEGYIDSQGQFWSSALLLDETVSPTYKLRERGYLNEYSFSWSGNFNNTFYLGASINIHELNYSLKSDYGEVFSSDGGYLNLINNFTSSGNGVGFKLGGIYAPIDYIRLGASIQTPIAYKIKDYFYADLNSGFNTDDGFINQSDGTPRGDNSFKLSGPLTYNLSAALIVGNKGLISVEYAGTQNSRARFMDNYNDSFDFEIENDSINALFNTMHTFKLGGEYKVNNNISLRAGAAFMNPPTLPRIGKEFYANTVRTDVDYLVQEGNSRYFTGGAGYRGRNWYVDLALINKVYSQKFYPYNNQSLDSNSNYAPANIRHNNFNVIATLGFRF